MPPSLGKKPANLLLDGAPGLGKTFLSACIARVVSEDGFSVVYDTAVHVFARCEAAKFRADEEPDAAVDVRRFESCDLLILDDLGTEMATGFVQSALYQLVNGRLLAGKSTIISTNLTPRADREPLWRGHLVPAAGGVYGAALRGGGYPQTQADDAVRIRENAPAGAFFPIHGLSNML